MKKLPEPTNAALMVVMAKTTELVRLVSEGASDIEADATTMFSELTFEERIDAQAYFLDRVDMEIDFFKSQADQLSKVVKRLKEIKEAAKDAIKLQMVSMGEDKVEGNSMRFTLSEREPKIEITDESVIPPEYTVEIVTHKVDTDKIKTDLCAGKKIEGAALVPVFALTKYVNRKIKAAVES